jgi:hypothetical protein
VVGGAQGDGVHGGWDNGLRGAWWAVAKVGRVHGGWGRWWVGHMEGGTHGDANASVSNQPAILLYS